MEVLTLPELKQFSILKQAGALLAGAPCHCDCGACSLISVPPSAELLVKSIPSLGPLPSQHMQLRIAKGIYVCGSYAPDLGGFKKGPTETRRHSPANDLQAVQ